MFWEAFGVMVGTIFERILITKDETNFNGYVLLREKRVKKKKTKKKKKGDIINPTPKKNIQQTPPRPGAQSSLAFSA